VLRCGQLAGDHHEDGARLTIDDPPVGPRIRAPGLRGLVHGYTGFVERATARLRRREFPSGRVTMIVNFGPPLAVSVPGERPGLERSFVAPISALPAVTEFSGVSRGVQVDLTPLGPHMLLGLPMDELPQPVVGLEQLLGRAGGLLVEQLATADQVPAAAAEPLGKRAFALRSASPRRPRRRSSASSGPPRCSAPSASCRSRRSRSAAATTTSRT
jgi:hypothetical protein